MEGQNLPGITGILRNNHPLTSYFRLPRLGYKWSWPYDISMIGFWENVGTDMPFLNGICLFSMEGSRYFIGDYEDYGYGEISIDELPSGYD